jgi:stearoyl-CoA desaturase (delta-9 desaturase)
VFFLIKKFIFPQFPIFKWARDHRVHHKFSDTDEDPHNSTRGMWFSHLGWMLEPDHPEFVRKANTLDFSDLDDDTLIRVQAK